MIASLASIRSTAPRGVAALLAFAVAAVACTKDAPARSRSASTRSAPGVKTEDSSAGTIDLGSDSYKPGSLSAMGTVSGSIKLVGTDGSDTLTVAKSRAACGLRGAGPAKGAPSHANTVVWIADPKSGKPFPMEKRGEISTDDCLLDPALQAVVVGSTVNVFNDDREIHRLVFTRLGSHDTLTVMPFFNNGQVVASERLAKEPQVVEVQCAHHPWMHGYIVVLDHPYFDVTDDDGAFKIDSIAPGTYDLMIWRAGMSKPMTQKVTIAANGTARVTTTIDRATLH